MVLHDRSEPRIEPAPTRPERHGPDLSQSTLPPRPVEPSSERSRSTESPVYCLWRHVASQVPVLEQKILAACLERMPKRIEIYQEAVGGAPHHRFALQREMNVAANHHSTASRRTVEWLLSGAQRVASAIAPSSSIAEALRDALCQERMLSMYRRLRSETGAEVSIRLIDVHEGHPSYSVVREESMAERSYHESLQRTVPHSRADRLALLNEIEGRGARSLRAGAAALAERNEAVRAELDSLLSKPAPETARFVLMGAGHVAVSRGLERLFASFSEEVESRLPPGSHATYNYSLSLMMCLKAASGRSLSVEDCRDAMVHELLRQAILVNAWGGRSPRSADRKERGVDLATCLATDALLNAGPEGRASLFDSCAKSLIEAREGERALEALIRPLSEAVDRLARGDGPLALGAIGHRLSDLRI